MNPGEAVCLRNCRARPVGASPVPGTQEEQDAELSLLLDWVRAYYSRSDDMSLQKSTSGCLTPSRVQKGRLQQMNRTPNRVLKTNAARLAYELFRSSVRILQPTALLAAWLILFSFSIDGEHRFVAIRSAAQLRCLRHA